jgi:hypothetical protein
MRNEGKAKSCTLFSCSLFSLAKNSLRSQLIYTFYLAVHNYLSILKEESHVHPPAPGFYLIAFFLPSACVSFPLLFFNWASFDFTASVWMQNADKCSLFDYLASTEVLLPLQSVEWNIYSQFVDHSIRLHHCQLIINWFLLFVVSSVPPFPSSSFIQRLIQFFSFTIPYFNGHFHNNSSRSTVFLFSFPHFSITVLFPYLLIFLAFPPSS